VHAAHDPLARARVVVLDEVIGHAELGEQVLPERLEEES
jgi:hypothetical protein